MSKTSSISARPLMKWMWSAVFRCDQNVRCVVCCLRGCSVVRRRKPGSEWGCTLFVDGGVVSRVVAGTVRALVTV